MRYLTKRKSLLLGLATVLVVSAVVFVYLFTASKSDSSNNNSDVSQSKESTKDTPRSPNPVDASSASNNDGDYRKACKLVDEAAAKKLFGSAVTVSEPVAVATVGKETSQCEYVAPDKKVNVTLRGYTDEAAAKKDLPQLNAANSKSVQKRNYVITVTSATKGVPDQGLNDQFINQAKEKL